MNDTLTDLDPVPPASVGDLRRFAAECRWPRKQLLTALLDWSEADARVHQLDVAEAFRGPGEPPAGEEYAAAVMARTRAFGRLEEERDYPAEVYLSGLGAAVERKPAELADLWAQVLALPAVTAAFVTKLEALLRPVFDHLTRENKELRARVADLEAVAAGVPG